MDFEYFLDQVTEAHKAFSAIPNSASTTISFDSSDGAVFIDSVNVDKRLVLSLEEDKDDKVASYGSGQLSSGKILKAPTSISEENFNEDFLINLLEEEF